MTWLELSCTCDADAVESMNELFTKHGHGGTVVEQPIELGEDWDTYRNDPDRPIVVRTWVPATPNGRAARAEIERGVWVLGMIHPVGELQTREVREEDWANAWKQYYRVQRLGRRTVVVPSWLEHDPAPDDVVVRLDPGMAFGTGLHPTTQLCLVALEELARPGMRVLDLGTGSGILAIAAARLGADPVLAVDIDEVAVKAARQNAALNGLEARIDVREGSLPLREAPFDLIAGNLIAGVIMPLASAIRDAMAPGGAALLSGIIADRLPGVVDALTAAGVTIADERRSGDWVLLVARRDDDKDEGLTVER